jgi:sulfur transfer protein SufE/stress-induced morphogen
MRRPSKPLLIAGIPIAGVAALFYNGGGGHSTSTCFFASAWSAPSPRSLSRTTVLHSAIEDTDLSTLHLTPELEMMTKAFASIPDEKTRHKQLLYMASKLPAVNDSMKISQNKVPGCLSTVHVDCTLEPKKDEEQVMVVNYYGDSDGLLTKGLLALLIRGLSGNTPEQIQKVNPQFIQAAKISQTLTPGRNNGFLNMLAVMKKKALEANEATGEEGGENNVVKGEGLNGDGNVKEEEQQTDYISTVTSFDPIEGKPMYNNIMSTLITVLKPTSITLIDNSSQHAGHAGSKGWAESGESHFALTIVAKAFEGLSLVKRHQLIYMLLSETMSKIHALEIKAKSPTEV